ncbi:pyrimidine dimer DNA glycosylase/endonuclease V [Agriterribacter sp.]|uniref:pyrimidine dimer DNA glycosylase/endonuclease V n=1 Tax=Agriterribacter sp. TaxID=2821509 RepID=UPI002CB9DF0A|nr:pyrimidine dimer DNA glycosylase/endonuclease V [Agriterribacter sp.]HTN06938.1 pyrimidine dimer DNA glycosylase/endonuclease V [Agriterribacter sp.]
MRIWSLHPKYLDTKGLLALWRETLLAKCVLEGKTKGYKNHPQLFRFKQMKQPLHAINHYLSEIYKEAALRNYHFDKSKIDDTFQPVTMTVTKGQPEYEKKHLLKKLEVRDRLRFEKLRLIKMVEPALLFREIEGPSEHWEIQIPEN